MNSYFYYPKNISCITSLLNDHFASFSYKQCHLLYLLGVIFLKEKCVLGYHKGVDNIVYDMTFLGAAICLTFVVLRACITSYLRVVNVQNDCYLTPGPAQKSLSSI